ncbi:hypothetical protein U2F26_13675 [Micromonospora sp. 4G57]|uniref:Uncharacterized protein n=1 Tax=Micromonospora sicca TaxID=2202420 RepID=A0ABU5JBA0_9ACTN|nr:MULTISPECIES: hypothetical protein [unclassified Micromonospora]MDZ5443773.1 hypothetical protein [Micromonospora sp. 4G57]MDZ5489709.1 hypothetical protein [Micromonospora sp. 4G53]
MTIMASAPVPASNRLIDADTVRFGARNSRAYGPIPEKALTDDVRWSMQLMTDLRTINDPQVTAELDQLLTTPPPLCDLGDRVSEIFLRYGQRLINGDTTPLIRRVGYSTPPLCQLSWCVKCVSPDPGVVDHYSKPWEGTDEFDGATWSGVVTQRYEQGHPTPAVIDFESAGTFGSLAALAADMLAADALATRINNADATGTAVSSCPYWCDQQCRSLGDGSSRLHTSPATTITDTVDGDTSVVSVSLQRLDEDGEAGQAAVIVETVSGPGDLGPDATTALIHALIKANAAVIADRAQIAGR